MSMLEHTVAVVINWNGGEENLTCLDALIQAGLPPERIQWVDNGSVDGSLELVRERYPDLCILANDENLGFARAANQGAAAAFASGAEAVFFVNNDVIVPPQTLPRLCSVLEATPNLGAVGPRVLYADRPDLVWAAGGVLAWGPNLTHLLGHGQADGPRWQETREVDYLPGCALLLSRAASDAVGLFEEAYFAYLEDVDLGLRLSEAGLRSLCVGDVSCNHAPSSSTGGGYSPRRKYLNARNTVHFLRSHGGARSWLSFLCWDVLGLPLLLLTGLVRGRLRGGLAKGLGLLHGFAGRPLDPQVLRTGGTRLW